MDKNIAYVIAKGHDREAKKCVIEEWKLLSRILDRLFALTYIFVTILCTLGVFLGARFGHEVFE